MSRLISLFFLDILHIKFFCRRLYPAPKWAKKNASINFATVAGIAPHRNHHLTFKISMAMCCALVSHEQNNNYNNRREKIKITFMRTNTCKLISFPSIFTLHSFRYLSREPRNCIHTCNKCCIIGMVYYTCLFSRRFNRMLMR